MKLNLRTKGILALLALTAYILAFGAIQAQQRQKLLAIADVLEQLYDMEDALDKASYAVAHSVLKLEDEFHRSSQENPIVESIALDVELIQAGLQGLQKYHPPAADASARLEREMTSLRAQPSRSSLLSLRETERDLSQHLDKLIRQTHDSRTALWKNYRVTHDTMTVIAVNLGLLGIVVFGAVVTLFLTRLTWDLRKLATRALEIVTGYRGAPLAIMRGDEIGDLMEAVNRMQLELRHREHQLEISRQQRFYQEKMAAIGSLAAAVAHEINNPIAAIAGIAQSMRDGTRFGQPPGGQSEIDPSALILAQTKRIATISRQIAELTAPHSLDAELLDLNALIRSTCSFIAYDRRFRAIDLTLELDSGIPAIKAVADHLTQVLMNLLINAVDALEDLDGRKHAIKVSTIPDGNSVTMTVSDNGQGMSKDVLAHAFDEGYTTKPAAKGRGLGLFLCKALVEQSGGTIELDSAPGAGTSARIRLPAPQPEGG